MQSIPAELFRSIIDLFGQFGRLATTPGQIVLLISGAIFLFAASAVFGYLAFGALVRPVGNLPTPNRGHRERREDEYRGH